MPEDLPEKKAEGEVPAAPRDLGSFAVGVGVAVITFFVALAVAFFARPDHQVALVVMAYLALVAAELVAGGLLRNALGRVAVGNALIIAALLSGAFLLMLGILKGPC
jgi:hypothetical protein